MTELRFGSIDKRELCLRFFAPYCFQRFTPTGFRFAPLRLLNPVNWWRAIGPRDNWELHWHRHNNATHRCWCDEGWLFDGNIRVAGFGVVWFYHKYTGKIPCPCNEAMDEVFGDEECEVPA